MNPREPKRIVVSLRIPESMMGLTQEQLDRRLPALVAEKSAFVGWSDGPLSQKDDVYGGAAIQRRNNDGLHCTTGFAVEASGGVTGLVTAEHCSPDGEDDLDYRASDGTEYEMTYVYGRDDNSGDFAWHTTGEAEDNRIYQSDTVLRWINGYQDDFDALQAGLPICKYGRKTGYTCDEILVAHESTNQVLMTSRKAGGGDSGGPWFVGNVAYGVHEGSAYVMGVKRDKFSAVALLDDSISVTVLTE